MVEVANEAASRPMLSGVALKKWLLSGLIVLLLVLSVFYNSSSTPDVLQNSIGAELPTLEFRKIWISLALCWGHNTNLNSKAHFPYDTAGQLSSKLWAKFNYSVIFQMVYCEDKALESVTFKEYVHNLTDAGAIVKLVKSDTCDKCVLTAQVSRLLAFHQSEVNPKSAFIV